MKSQKTKNKKQIAVTLTAHCLLFTAYWLLPISTFAQNYPALTADIAWNGNGLVWGEQATTVADVQAAFNIARAEENKALGTKLPSITFPSNTTWSNMTNSDKALWIINIERKDRGLTTFQGTDARVIKSAQDYAKFLVDNKKFGHVEDGLDPLKRLTNASTATPICVDWDYRESIGYRQTYTTNFLTTAGERIIYNFIYEDKASTWSHRNDLFIKTFVDDNGQTGVEGILGVGVVTVPNYFFNNPGYATVAVFDYFDPCKTYTVVTAITESSENNTISIYPNPSSGVFSLAVETRASGQLQINVTNVLGERVYHFLAENINGKYSDEIAMHVPSGFYFMQLQLGEKVMNKKIVVE